MGYPTVNRAVVDGFLKVYNKGGLHLLFDEKSRDAMMDFANIVLKNYVDNLVENAKKMQAAKAQAANAPAPAQPPAAPAPEPPKSGIILTDS